VAVKVGRGSSEKSGVGASRSWGMDNAERQGNAGPCMISRQHHTSRGSEIAREVMCTGVWRYGQAPYDGPYLCARAIGGYRSERWGNMEDCCVTRREQLYRKLVILGAHPEGNTEAHAGAKDYGEQAYEENPRTRGVRAFRLGSVIVRAALHCGN